MERIELTLAAKKAFLGTLVVRFLVHKSFNFFCIIRNLLDCIQEWYVDCHIRELSRGILVFLALRGILVILPTRGIFVILPPKLTFGLVMFLYVGFPLWERVKRIIAL